MHLTRKVSRCRHTCPLWAEHRAPCPGAPLSTNIRLPAITTRATLLLNPWVQGESSQLATETSISSHNPCVNIVNEHWDFKVVEAVLPTHSRVHVQFSARAIRRMRSTLVLSLIGHAPLSRIVNIFRRLTEHASTGLPCRERARQTRHGPSLADHSRTHQAGRFHAPMNRGYSKPAAKPGR